MFSSKRARIQKRREMLPGQGIGAQPGARSWETEALGMTWNVATPSPDLKSMAHVMIQALRRNVEPADSRSVRADVVLAGQAR